jgi:hypothetical protein
VQGTRKSLAPDSDGCNPAAPLSPFHDSVIATQHRSSVATSTPVPNRLNSHNKARRPQSRVGRGYCKTIGNLRCDAFAPREQCDVKELKGSF